MRRLLGMITIAVTLVATRASAVNLVHLKQLKDTNKCICCDLIFIQLTNAKLTDAGLSKADLNGASRLESCKLRAN